MKARRKITHNEAAFMVLYDGYFVAGSRWLEMPKGIQEAMSDLYGRDFMRFNSGTGCAEVTDAGFEALSRFGMGEYIRRIKSNRQERTVIAERERREQEAAAAEAEVAEYLEANKYAFEPETVGSW